MGYSRKLVPPIVAAAAATIAFNSFTVIMMVQTEGFSRLELFGAVWPVVLTSALAVLLVMSSLYRSLQDVVRKLEKRESAAQHEALHDQLTGLANRVLLGDRLSQALVRCGRSGEKTALLMLDLDRFKDVNDTFGHAAGDVLVRQVADRLLKLLRETDTVARLGGDEFAIIVDSPKSLGDVRVCCRKIVEAIREPFHLGGPTASIGVSIGAVLLDGSDSDAGDALRRADITMYHAKASGRDCYRIFCEDMDRSVQRRHKVEQRLRAELEGGEALQLWFQPQLDRRGRMSGVEALLRWEDEELGDVSPDELLPIAEECGMIGPIGDFVVRRACEAARRWPELSIAINVSPRQFRDPSFAQRLTALVREEQVGCRQLELEITETLLVEHGELCRETLQELRREGFRIALDDFGTGYSSLSYLRHIKVDRIKLDRSFIDHAQAQESAAIIEAAVSLATAMKLEVVAEGIATRAQERMARNAGCHAFQGYFYAPALPAEEIERRLRSGMLTGKAA